jgi:hypothetical protein
MSEVNDIRRHTLPNVVILGEVRQLIAEGHPVVIRVKGSSMLPFIVGDRDSVRLIACKTYHIGDIALAEDRPEHFVLHRIIALEGNSPDDKVTMRGDGVLYNMEHCCVRELVGRADMIVRNGREVNPYSRYEWNKYKLWSALRPLRRWLLAVVRRLPKYQYHKE